MCDFYKIMSITPHFSTSICRLDAMRRCRGLDKKAQQNTKSASCERSEAIHTTPHHTTKKIKNLWISASLHSSHETRFCSGSLRQNSSGDTLLHREYARASIPIQRLPGEVQITPADAHAIFTTQSIALLIYPHIRAL